MPGNKEAKKEPNYKLCKHGHKNSPVAKQCWVCGNPIEEDKPKQPEKPIFIQKTSTTVPTNYNDVNIVKPGECEQYVGKRERCDEKDPSGVICGFRPNCAIRLSRYKKKPNIDTVQS